MRIEELLRQDGAVIVELAWPTVARLEHYERDGAEATRRRLDDTFRALAAAVSTRDLAPLRAHAARVATERAAEGFELFEVHAALAMLEDAIARHVRSVVPAGELASELELVSTAMASARDALGRAFVARARRAPAAAAAIAALSRLGARPLEDLVYPV